jgi:hypothetical protein
MGGLGNQIFQIFATISYAIKSRNPFKFLNVETLGSGQTTLRHTYWNSFFSKFKPLFLMINLPQPIHVIREKDFTYNELPIYEMLNRDVLIYGYFQSYKYFQENYNQIYKMIGIDNMKSKLLNELYIPSEYLNNTISMHFRIGDYKKNQHFHPLATYDYYKRSLEHIKKVYPKTDFEVLYFCEDVDIDDVLEKIHILQNKFPEYKFIRGENMLEDWEQLLLMSCCHHNIIANSSFSWWAAYFNSWKDKIVCYPSVWFGPTANNDTVDLCPNEWIKISV